MSTDESKIEAEQSAKASNPEAPPSEAQGKSLARRLLVGELSWKRMLISILCIYVSLLAFAVFASEGLIFRPHAPGYKDSERILKLKCADGVDISAVHYPNPKARYTILYSHGNAEDLGDNFRTFRDLVGLGFSVFAYDYHGYGTSGGKPSEAATYLDINAAYAYLTETLKVPPASIIVYSRSVGGGPGVDLASRKPVGGLILESCFTRAFLVATKVPIVPFDRFRNIDKLPKVQCPVLVMHGAKDRVVPFAHGQALFATAKEPKRSLWVDEAGHNDFRWQAGPRYAAAIADFMSLLP